MRHQLKNSIEQKIDWGIFQSSNIFASINEKWMIQTFTYDQS